MINIKDKYTVLGVMSGTSMDGLDLSCATYSKKLDAWDFNLLKGETIPYNESIKEDFINGFNRKISIEKLDNKFGNFIADHILFFCRKNNFHVDLISSHGHTIFHEPQNGITKQIGNGKVIAERTHIPVVSNFRQQDVDLGGQGAPLVPMGDKLLFSNYDSCINLGGIVNISYNHGDARLAFDICPCNMLLNYFANQKGKRYDNKGIMASKGNVSIPLLNQLSTIDYYQYNGPKSLSKEYIDSIYLPIINIYKLSTVDILSTLVEHIAMKIADVLLSINQSNSLLSGGGVYNSYLISRVRFHTNTKITIPISKIVDFKESIIFGFLGLLRILNEDNCLASATGASRNHSSGDIFKVEC